MPFNGIIFCCSYFLYSITHPNSFGEPTVDLSHVPVVSAENLTELQIKHYSVIQTLFTVYGITTSVTKNLCDVLRSKLWRMGQRLNKPGAKVSDNRGLEERKRISVEAFY